MLKFFFFLNKRFLFSFFLLIFSIFIGSLLELISLASIIPILEIIRSKSINNLNPTLNEFVKYLNINSYEDLKKAGIIQGVSIGAKGAIDKDTGEITDVCFDPYEEE